MPAKKKKTTPTAVTVKTPEIKEEPNIVVEEKPEAKASSKPANLQEHLLALYNVAESGVMDIEKLKEITGATEEQLMQTWDRLYDYGKVGFSKFVKP